MIKNNWNFFAFLKAQLIIGTMIRRGDCKERLIGVTDDGYQICILYYSTDLPEEKNRMCERQYRNL